MILNNINMLNINLKVVDIDKNTFNILFWNEINIVPGWSHDADIKWVIKTIIQASEIIRFTFIP